MFLFVGAEAPDEIQNESEAEKSGEDEEVYDQSDYDDGYGTDEETRDERDNVETDDYG